MKRGGPLKRGKPLKSGGALKRSPIKRRSSKREKFMREKRRPLIESLIEAGFSCEISPVLDEYGIAHECTREIQGMHERRKRSSGGSLTNKNNLVPACNACNSLVECEPKIIRELTGDLLVVREGDAEWESLGARQDNAR